MKEQTLSGWELATSDLTSFFFVRLLFWSHRSNRTKPYTALIEQNLTPCTRDVQVDLDKKCGAKKCGGRYKKCGRGTQKNPYPLFYLSLFVYFFRLQLRFKAAIMQVSKESWAKHAILCQLGTSFIHPLYPDIIQIVMLYISKTRSKKIKLTTKNN
jgi:hypothetical protein